MGKKSTIILFAVMTMLASSLCFGMAIVSETGQWPDSWPKELEPFRKQAKTIQIAAGHQENVYEIRFENREQFEKLWPIILKLKDKGAPLRLRSIEKPIKKGSLYNSDRPVVRVFSHVYPAWPIHRSGSKKLRPAPPWPDSIKSPTGALPEYATISEDGNAWMPVERERPGDFMWIPAEGEKPGDFMWRLVEEGKPRGFMYRARTEIELVVDGTIIDLNRILLPPDTPIIDRRFQEKTFAEQIQSAHEPAKTVDELVKAFSDAEYFWQQGDIARELVTLGDTTIIPRIKKYLDTQDRRRRCNAALVLAGLGDKRGVSIIIGELEDKKPRPTHMRRSDGRPYPEGQIRSDRYYAALLLGQLGDKKAVPSLIEATKEKSINYQAAISLGKIGDKSVIPALHKMAEDFPDERLWAGYGLAALGEPEGFDILTEVVVTGSHWTERRHAVTALGDIGDPKTLPTVIKALKDDHVNVRVSAARALGEIGDPAALPALIEALDDTDVTKINAPTTVEKEARKAIKAIKAKMARNNGIQYDKGEVNPTLQAGVKTLDNKATMASLRNVATNDLHLCTKTIPYVCRCMSLPDRKPPSHQPLPKWR